MLEFHAEAPQAYASEGLAQGSYVAARAGFEPMTLRMKGDESTIEPPHPGSCNLVMHVTVIMFLHNYVL